MADLDKTKEKQYLIGRSAETVELRRIGDLPESSILVIYGRRRVGKTSLIESVFAKRNLIKIEGAEGVKPDRQLELATQQLKISLNLNNLTLSAFSNWLEFFHFLAKETEKGIWTLYFEELQWLAGESSSFVAEFKIAWDNYFRKNPKLLVVLCGSSPTFMVSQVLRSKALYNRSQHELHLQEFALSETKEFMGARYSDEQVLDAHLLVGGIPEYLKYLKEDRSVFISLCKNSFKSNGYFVNEYERVFASTLAKNQTYRGVIEILSVYGAQTRASLLQRLKLRSGGGISAILEELVLCGFVDRYAPYNLQQDGKSVRYAIGDNYLHFYNKFIRPNLTEIGSRRFDVEPTSAINKSDLDLFMSHRFEQFCRKNHWVIAKILGFSAVKYRAGAFFQRKSLDADDGFQWDLVFSRADKVLTLCEIKYTSSPVGRSVIEDCETRIEKTRIPVQKSIQRVLISVKGASRELTEEPYFDRIVTLKDFF